MQAAAEHVDLATTIDYVCAQFRYGNKVVRSIRPKISATPVTPKEIPCIA
jgi:hypothetical protein